MDTSKSFEALRRANPRTSAGFPQSVESAAEAVRAQVVSTPTDGALVAGTAGHRRRLVRASAAGAAIAAAVAAALFLPLGSPDGGPGVETAAAAVRQAATVTAASAERSGTAVVRMTHDGEAWAGTTIRWHGRDVAVSRDEPGRRGKVGSALLVVDGIFYGIDPGGGGWVAQGSPKNIDPDSGTTPDEYLAAVREDVGGATLRRLAGKGGVSGLTTTRLADGSTVYRGTVAGGLIARETGFKEGRSIRVLPFGYVAHGEAADPAAPLDAAVTVGPDGIVREIAIAWGTWTYTVEYSNLGSTPAPVAPAHPRSLLKERLRVR